MPIFLGAVADDDTGASDLGGMLTAQGMRVAVVLGVPDMESLARWTDGCDAVILGTASRSIEKSEAYTRTRAAFAMLRQLGTQRLMVKYCSTFDSTAEGNIGASIDAAMDEAGVNFTVALPALPALGRTTYMGYHFVGEQLLSDSALRTHPLNPMTNAHLPSHLSAQTLRRVALLPYSVVREGTDAAGQALSRLQESGANIVLLDCMDEAHLRALSSACQHMLLLTGSSAWGIDLPGFWQSSGEWRPAPPRPLARAAGGTGILIVSGSCSPATEKQNAWGRGQHWDTWELDAHGLANGEVPLDALRVAEAVSAGKTVLITTQGAGRQDVAAASSRLSVTPAQVAELISDTLAVFVVEIFAHCSPMALLAAGGETSSTLMRALHLGGFFVGSAIEAGVPLCVALRRPELAVVLKSGNFGGEDFYGRAVAAIQHMPVIDAKEGNSLHE